MPFARFENFEACTLEMTKMGHDSESANKICGAIKDRAEKGVLYKAETVGLQILSKADSEDIVLGGYCSWDMPDDQRDIFTIDAQAKAMQKFFAQPKEYQSVTINHKEFKGAQPILKYTDTEGETFYSHPNEKGSYLLSLLRNDNLKTTQYYRDQARKGNLDGYSVTAVPIGDPVLVKASDGKEAKQWNDMEYWAITITEKGVMKPVNPMTRNVKVLSKAGGCDLEQCKGACCRGISQFYSKATPEFTKYMVMHGAETKATDEGVWVRYPVVCKSFNEETCQCNNYENRPEACRIYPRGGVSPFVSKAICSLQTGLEATQKSEAIYPPLNTLESATSELDLELILQKHGFNKAPKIRLDSAKAKNL